MDIRDMLAQVEDLETVTPALARESVIRSGMAETGEDRQSVADLLDAALSMDQEGVLELTDGEPTTLADALRRYVEDLEQNAATVDVRSTQAIVGELDSLLAYPWPGPDAEALTQEIHRTYVRLAPEHGFEIVPWDDLEESQRTMARAIVSDLAARGSLVVGPA